MRKFPRKYKRRTFVKKRRYGRKRTTNIIRAAGPVAPRTIVRLKYVESFASSGAAIDQVFNLNSIFDPNRTGTGHQPYGRDTYAVLYNRYRVYRVTAKILANSSDAGGSRLVVVPTNTATAFTNPSLAAEMPRAYISNFNTGNPATFIRKFNLPSIVGQTSAQYKADDRFQALMSTDPAEVIALHVVATDAVGGAVANVFYTVELTYHVEMFDPEPLSQS